LKYLTCKKGFTLVELIVVVSIISLMIGFIVPNLDSFLSKDRSKKAVRSVFYIVQSLRSKAKKNFKDYYLIINPSNDTYAIGNGSDSPENEKIIGSDISIESIQVPGAFVSRMKKAYIKFYKKGYNDPFVMVLKNRSDDKVFSIYVHPFLFPPETYDKPVLL